MATAANAQTPQAVASTITLSVTPAEAIINSGTPVTLAAKVSVGEAPIRRGVVIFCDAAAASCQDGAILGKAQLTSDGTAGVKLKFGVGSYAIKAVFQGTSATIPSFTGSVSATSKLKIVTVKTAAL
jgi:hypothetical protein